MDSGIILCFSSPIFHFGFSLFTNKKKKKLKNRRVDKYRDAANYYQHQVYYYDNTPKKYIPYHIHNILYENVPKSYWHEDANGNNIGFRVLNAYNMQPRLSNYERFESFVYAIRMVNQPGFTFFRNTHIMLAYWF